MLAATEIGAIWTGYHPRYRMREVEIVIEAHPDVGLVAVLGVPDEVFGEVGHAFVEPKPGASLDVAELDE